MRELSLTVAMALCAVAFPAQRANAQHAMGVQPIVVRNAWSRPALNGGTGVVFMEIENGGAAAVHLTSVQSAVAKAVEMHQSMTQGSETMMHPMTDIQIAAHGKFKLMPGDVHVMLIGLKRALAVGDSIPITLVFANGSHVKSTAIVRVP